jgi:hypothetical protein
VNEPLFPRPGTRPASPAEPRSRKLDKVLAALDREQGRTPYEIWRAVQAVETTGEAVRLLAELARRGEARSEDHDDRVRWYRV